MPTTTRFVPLNDFVLLEEDAPTPYHTYKGLTHIVVPEQYEHGPEDRAVMGVVRGKGKQCRNADIQIGHRVTIGKWMGARFSEKDKTMIVVKEDDILAIVTPDHEP